MKRQQRRKTGAVQGHHKLNNSYKHRSMQESKASMGERERVRGEYILVAGIPRSAQLYTLELLRSRVRYGLVVPENMEELAQYIHAENDLTIAVCLPVVGEGVPENYAEYLLTEGDAEDREVAKLRVQRCSIREQDTKEIGFITVLPPKDHYNNFLEDLYQEIVEWGIRREDIFLKVWARSLEGKPMPMVRVLVNKSVNGVGKWVADEGEWRQTSRGYIYRSWTKMKLAQEWELAHRRAWKEGRRQYYHPVIFIWVVAGVKTSVLEDAIREIGLLRDHFSVKRIKDAPDQRSWLALVSPTPADIPEEEQAMEAMRMLNDMGIRNRTPLYSSGIKHVLFPPFSVEETRSARSVNTMGTGATTEEEDHVVERQLDGQKKAIEELTRVNTQLREELKTQGDQFASRLAALEDMTKAELRRQNTIMSRSIKELQDKTKNNEERLDVVDQELRKNEIRDAKLDAILDQVARTTRFITGMAPTMMVEEPNRLLITDDQESMEEETMETPEVNVGDKRRIEGAILEERRKGAKEKKKPPNPPQRC